MAVHIDGEKYLTTTEVSNAVGISRQTLWRWRSQGHIPLGSKYRGHQIIFNPSEVELIKAFADRIEPIRSEKRKEMTLFEQPIKQSSKKI